MVRHKETTSLYNKTRKFITGNKNTDWVSGTNVANYLLKDPLIDWLNLYYNKLGFNNCRLSRSSMRKNKQANHRILKTRDNPLFKNGLLFESKVYESLQAKFGGDFVNLKCGCEDADYERTLDAIENKTPIICQAFIKSDRLKLRGIVDMLVRSDFINKLVDVCVLENIYDDKGELYYVVVDIKWSHITFCVDGKTTRNSGRVRPYKGQLFIYNTIIGEMQNFTPKCAYILPKSWNVDRKGYTEKSSACFTRMGIVDFTTRDVEIVNTTIDAINWVRNVRLNGTGWSPLTPSLPEMRCNSCNQDESWSRIKNQIMDVTRDITRVWMLSPEHRNILMKQGIKSWDDSKLDMQKIPINNLQTVKAITNIIKANRDDSKFNIIATRLVNDGNWLVPSKNDMFVDYETISYEFTDIQNMNILNSTTSTFIIMIGLGTTETGNFEFQNFTCNAYTGDEEVKNMTRFMERVSSRIHLYPSEPVRIFHWGHVEKTLLEDYLKRYDKKWDDITKITWVDMYSIFVKSCIGIKGALSYKLKEVSAALYNLGVIHTKWDNATDNAIDNATDNGIDNTTDNAIDNGMNAMMEAIKYYTESPNHTRDNLNRIKSYNEVDCKVLSEIVSYLRLLNF